MNMKMISMTLKALTEKKNYLKSKRTITLLYKCKYLGMNIESLIVEMLFTRAESFFFFLSFLPSHHRL